MKESTKVIIDNWYDKNKDAMDTVSQSLREHSLTKCCQAFAGYSTKQQCIVCSCCGVKL